MKTVDKARAAIARIKAHDPVSKVRDDLSSDASDWFRISAKAYALHLKEARKERDEVQKKPHVAATPNEVIDEILAINEGLSRVALCIPAISTLSDVNAVKLLMKEMPASERLLLSLVETMTLEPRIRALQNIGRIRQFKIFKEFAHIVEAATVSYYRGNYVSSYLTLVPVIEGLILRWSGYTGRGEKPEFEEIRRFFSISHVRQPCPSVPLFHNVFAKACHRIINDHLYKPSGYGTAHSEFNRHQASHLLRDSDFATRENCIRLFLLLDLMAEIYRYETWCDDPRWYLEDSDISKEVSLYSAMLASSHSGVSPESLLLKKAVR